MKRKAILGTVLLSAFAMDSFANPAQQRQQQPQQQQPQQQRSSASLARMQEICRDMMNNPQMKDFENEFWCDETRTNWNKVGVQKYPLLNESGVSFKALMKDDRLESDWMHLPGFSEKQWGQCDVIEKFQATARFATKLTCDQLLAITSEQAFCAEQLEPVWAQCDAEQQDAMAAGGRFMAPRNGACEYTDLNMVRKCVDGDVAVPQKQHCQQQQQQCAAQAQTCSVDQSPAQCQQQQQQCQQQVAMCDAGFGVSEFELGADVRVVTVDRCGIHKHHKAVEISTDCLPGGMLESLGLGKGDVISTINSHRTRTEGDFVKFLAKAKHKGHARIEFRSGVDGKWRTQKINKF